MSENKDITNEDVIKRINDLEINLFKRVLDYLDTMKKDILAAVDAKLDIFENNMADFKDYVNKRIDYQDKIIHTLADEIDRSKDFEPKCSQLDKALQYVRFSLLGVNTAILIYVLLRLL